MSKIKLNARLKELHARSKLLAAKAELTTDEQAELAALATEFKQIVAKLEAWANAEAMPGEDEPGNEEAEPAAAGDPTDDVAPPVTTASNAAKVRAALRSQKNLKAERTGGFNHVGEFAVALMGDNRAAPESMRDKRMVAITKSMKALDGGNTQVPREGGYAVPVQFAGEILQLMKATNGLVQYCNPLKTSGGDFEQPVDPNEPWSASGVQVGYLDELADMPVQKPDLKEVSIKLAETGALVKLSNRLMKDAAMVASLIRTNVPNRLNSFMSKQILSGDGVGRHFVGAIGHASEVVVAAVSGQGASTIVGQNIAAMYASVPVQFQNSFIWVHHPLALPQLLLLRDPAGNPLVQWNNTFRDGLGGFTLLGRPLVAQEWCSALGTKGDIIAFSGEGYGLLSRTGTEATLEESMHVYFNSNSYALRFVLEAGGAPLWPTAGVYPNTSGNGKFSPIVTLNSTRT